MTNSDFFPVAISLGALGTIIIIISLLTRYYSSPRSSDDELSSPRKVLDSKEESALRVALLLKHVADFRRTILLSVFPWCAIGAATGAMATFLAVMLGRNGNLVTLVYTDPMRFLGLPATIGAIIGLGVSIIRNAR